MKRTDPVRMPDGAFPLQACWSGSFGAARRDPGEPSRHSEEGRSILLVDDDAGIRHVARAILMRHDYGAILAANAEEALAIFARLSGQIAVVLTDLAMPGMDGLALIRAIRQIKPTVKIIVSTGAPGDFQGEKMQTLQVDACLRKPFTRQALLRAIKPLLPPIKSL